MVKTLESISSRPGDFGHFMVLAQVLYEHSIGDRKLTRKQLKRFDKEIKDLALDARTAIYDSLVRSDSEYKARFGTSDRIFEQSADFFRKTYIKIGSRQ